jgi:hypothetical protein
MEATLFHTFALLGGIAEITVKYAESKDITSANRYFKYGQQVSTLYFKKFLAL